MSLVTAPNNRLGVVGWRDWAYSQRSAERIHEEEWEINKYIYIYLEEKGEAERGVPTIVGKARLFVCLFVFVAIWTQQQRQ